ncbi:hypothetical protein ETD86_54145 [Nonomuraea turkmeniaca]|uniref:Radical SAM protein n=1 Tax=Nonomuraea turkmeniaca TaxID=103838 RepID=A0A5S4FDW1_9ACTN|nr:hypothetical protein [Nonomuraea turkmeniaca]TMR02679.1 hypothetical protein ETD86_54145 [Nonomuraea turkmeniaca]
MTPSASQAAGTVAVGPTNLRCMPDDRQAAPRLYMFTTNRTSGLSLNQVIGCPLDCVYCVRHFGGNFDERIPRRLYLYATAGPAVPGPRRLVQMGHE